jgi:hypothetical protein
MGINAEGAERGRIGLIGQDRTYGAGGRDLSELEENATN